MSDHRHLSAISIRSILLCLAPCLAVLAIASGHAADAAIPPTDETQMNAAGVTAVEQHWNQAEERGDTAYLDQLLLPEYRSISSDGTARPKAAIMASAARNRGSDATAIADAAYLKAHPSDQTVVVHGDTAIMSFYNPALGAQTGVRSSDILVYRDGHWHALYSQHSKAADS